MLTLIAITMDNQVIEWKWKLVIEEVFEKSLRSNAIDNKDVDTNTMNAQNHIYNTNTNMNANNEHYQHIFNETKFNEQFTRAYDSSKKFMNENDMNRMKTVQTTINPYLRNNDYLSDLANEDKFLRPKSSTLNIESSSSSQS